MQETFGDNTVPFPGIPTPLSLTLFSLNISLTLDNSLYFFLVCVCVTYWMTLSCRAHIMDKNSAGAEYIYIHCKFLHQMHRWFLEFWTTQTTFLGSRAKHYWSMNGYTQNTASYEKFAALVTLHSFGNKSFSYSCMCWVLIKSIRQLWKNSRVMFSSVTSHLARDDVWEMLLHGHQQTLYDATNSPKATTRKGLLQTPLPSYLIQ